MSCILTAAIAFAAGAVAGLVVMGIFKARATTFLNDELARMKARLP